MFKSIKSQELKNLLSDKSKNFQVIDVRTNEEWNESHIDDSRVKHIELDKFLSNPEVINKNEDLYLICASGGRSGYCQMLLFTKKISAINVEGGMDSFKKLK
jgi:phage shock protein E